MWLAGLLLGALAILVLRPQTRQQTLDLPFQAPSLPAGLRESPSLPADPGQLSGHSLLLVTLDTTRVDRIGIYGNRDIESPTLDRLAREGVVFSRAVATTPTTLPSHASIFTGLYPPRHGARANGVFSVSREHATLAEVLSAEGYATAAVVSSFVLNAKFGLARGFDLYDDETGRDAPRERLRDPERPADLTTDRALEWIGSQAHAPFFLWVHYYDPHGEYQPPAPFDERYRNNRYDGEIAFVDAQLGRLLRGLEKWEPTGDILIAIVADHGESLGDHGESTHGFLLHEATQRVPLLLHDAGLRGGVHVTERVSQVDLMPTLLSLLGVAIPEGIDGWDLTRPAEVDRDIYAETLQGRIEYGWAPLRAPYRAKHKYIAGPFPELYDLERDPLEQRNLYTSHPTLAKPLAAQIAAWSAGDPEIPSARVELDAEEIARLEALGYGIGASHAPGAISPRASPKQMLPLLRRVQVLALQAGSEIPTPEAIEILEGISRSHADFVPAAALLADLQREQGDRQAAEATLRRAMQASGRSPASVIPLSNLLVERGAHEEAISELLALVRSQPQRFDAHYYLGQVLLGRGRYSEAADHLRAAYEINPNDPSLREPLRQSMRRSGRSAELRTLVRSTR